MNNKIYLGSIQLNNYTSFVGENHFDLRDENGHIYQWTVILGNNNTGKTNFLKAVADLEPFQLPMEKTKTLSVPFRIHKAIEGDISYKKEAAKKVFVGCTLYYDNDKSNNYIFNKVINEYYHDTQDKVLLWGFYPFTVSDYTFLQDLKIYGYGVSRHYSESTLTDKEENGSNSATLFDQNKPLINLEEWLLQLDYAVKNSDKVAEKRLAKLKELIKSEIFPEIKEIRFVSKDTKNYVEFQTIDGWFRLKDLGYGYQITLSWIFDLSKKLFERFPDSENPLKEPAVVLVDELDLHLHPQWQRQIIKYLSDIFTQTQFIVTTHSPFIIQSIEKINLFILVKTDKGIEVKRPSYKTFKGWSIEEILDELLGLGENTKSDNYQLLMKQFDNALDSNNYEQALKAHNQLIEILHPTSPERKLLKLQLSQFVPNDKT